MIATLLAEKTEKGDHRMLLLLADDDADGDKAVSADAAADEALFAARPFSSARRRAASDAAEGCGGDGIVAGGLRSDIT